MLQPVDQKGENLPVNNHQVADLEEMNIQGQHLVSPLAGLSCIAINIFTMQQYYIQTSAG